MSLTTSSRERLGHLDDMEKSMECAEGHNIHSSCSLRGVLVTISARLPDIKVKLLPISVDQFRSVEAWGVEGLGSILGG